MKQLKAFFALCGCLSMMVACQQGVQVDTAQIGAKADSIVQAQTTALTDSVNAACTQRMTTEVPAKVDSIVKATKDSLAKAAKAAKTK